MQNVRPEYLLPILQNPIYEDTEEEGRRRRNDIGCGYNNHIPEAKTIV